VAGIKIGRGFPSPLWHHFRRIPFAGHPTRAELLPRLIILGLPRSAVIELVGAIFYFLRGFASYA
jgi:hypothetical protein